MNSGDGVALDLLLRPHAKPRHSPALRLPRLRPRREPAPAARCTPSPPPQQLTEHIEDNVGRRRGSLASGPNTRPSGREQIADMRALLLRTCLVPHCSAREIFSSLNRRVLINVSPMTHSWCTSVAEVKSSRYILLGWTFPGGLSPQVSLVVCVGLSSVVRYRSLFSYFSSFYLFISLHNCICRGKEQLLGACGWACPVGLSLYVSLAVLRGVTSAMWC
jgi:hypothetical protein